MPVASEKELVEGFVMTSSKSARYDPLEYIRNYYKVPAFKNRVVKAHGKFGVITGASGPHVALRLSEEKNSRPYHPDDVDYLIEASGEGSK
jgi:hypothetical protein